MTIGVVMSVIGLLLLAEGALLIFTREAAWRQFCKAITKLSVGQVRTVGIAMVICGVLLLTLFLTYTGS